MKNKWHFLVIDDPEFLIKKSCLTMIKFIVETCSFKFVITDYIFGTGANYAIKELQDSKDTPMTPEQLYQKFNDVKQLEWGDFFFFNDFPNDWSNPKGELYPYVVVQSDTTLKAVDNSYFIIYTPSEMLVKSLKTYYKIKEFKFGQLENFDYPE